MTQRNSAERTEMLTKRRAEQLARTGGDKFVPVYSKPRRSKKGAPNRHIIKLGGERYHATRGARPLTAYEKLQASS